MPSFDIVSTLNKHEVNNAVDQANREVGTRFDFKGSGAIFIYAGTTITLKSETDFQLKQMMDILQAKLAKRQVDLGHLEIGEPVIQYKSAQQEITLKEGIAQDIAKKIIKLIKDQKFKVQATIQGEQVRVTGKKRDDLQEVIALLRKQSVGIPLQFENFRE
jgi:uncharacterized protein YajQ (UPF0234 family)